LCADETLRVSSTPHSFQTCSTLSPQAHATEDVTRVPCIVCITVKRKTITIREDQDEWIENNHLNLSSFIREQLDELIEERE